MNYVWKFMSNFKEAYKEINSATLTGAIDVIVVQQEDGSFCSSPFHVRFGKIGVLRSREKIVEIEINGEPVDIYMKLGETGEAFFVEEAEDSSDVPSHLVTSPIPTYPLNGEDLISKDDDMYVSLPPDSFEFNDISKYNDLRQPEIANANHTASIFNSEQQSLEVVVENSSANLEISVLCRPTELHLTNSTADFCESDLLPSPTKTFKAEEITSNGVALMDSSTFVPIRHEEISVAVQTEANLSKSFNLLKMDSQDGSEVGVESLEGDDDKIKSKKKRKRKSMQRKKKNKDCSTPNSSVVVTDEHGDSGFKESGSSEDLACQACEESEDKSEDLTTAFNDTELGNSIIATASMISCKEDWQSTNSLTSLKMPSFSRDFHPYSDGDVSPTSSPSGSRPGTPKSDTEYEIRKMEAASQTEDERNNWSWMWGELPMPPKGLDEINLENSNPAMRTVNEKNEQEQGPVPILSGMFSFMKPSKSMLGKENEGIYLADLDSNDLDPEIAALYFPSRNSNWSRQHGNEENKLKDEDIESGNGSSLPQSPHSVEGAIGSMHLVDSDSEERHGIFDFRGYSNIALSLCGGLQDLSDITQEKFINSLVTYSEFSKNPKLLSSPDLVIRIREKYYNWQTAAPVLMSLILYQRPLPEGALSQLFKEHMPKKTKKGEGKGYSWFSWRRTTIPVEENSPVDISPSVTVDKQIPEVASNLTDDKQSTDVEITSVTTTTETLQVSAVETPKSVVMEMDVSKVEKNELRIDIDENSTPFQSPILEEPPETNIFIDNVDGSGNDSESSNEELGNIENKDQFPYFPGGHEKYKKTLRLTSEQIAKLNLQQGPNEVVFSVTTAYQGTTRCKCHIFMWRYDDHVVISDIDGTITKSDVLGHILPIIGKSWAQSGVAQLFTNIKNNGYQFLYLSARAIGQARITRDYLKSIRQGDVSLPDGPLLLNPSSLLSAFHREVIEKKPEEFKISCLRDIKALFPTTRNPYYAGYGNKLNDVWAYRAVEIPMSRIFTINHRGELKHDLTQTFQSSYLALSDVVDNLFPPLQRTDKSNNELATNFIGAEEFSSFTYWRNPLPEIYISLELCNENRNEEKK